MKQTRFNFFLWGLLVASAAYLASCHPASKTISTSRKTSFDSLRWTLTSVNLSENMTGNDEILILAYEQDESAQPVKLLFWKKLEFKVKNQTQKFLVERNVSTTPMMVFLIEQDSESPVTEIDAALRSGYKNIIKELIARNYSGVERFLGDEDFLGHKSISAIDCTNPYSFVVSGIYKVDRYEYRLKIECL